MLGLLCLIQWANQSLADMFLMWVGLFCIEREKGVFAYYLAYPLFAGETDTIASFDLVMWDGVGKLDSNLPNSTLTPFLASALSSLNVFKEEHHD